MTKIRIAKHHSDYGKTSYRVLHKTCDIGELKYCPYCDNFHPLDEFNKSKSRWDGLQTNCRWAESMLHLNRNTGKKLKAKKTKGK